MIITDLQLSVLADIAAQDTRRPHVKLDRSTLAELVAECQRARAAATEAEWLVLSQQLEGQQAPTPRNETP